MKTILRATILGVVMLLAAALPLQAMDTSKGTCNAQVGSNTVTYNCNYVANGYALGTPLSLKLDYSCTVRCGGVLAFGLSGPGYAPKGEVDGHVVSVERSAGSITFELMFEKLHEAASAEEHTNGTAFMSMMLNVDDGGGRMKPTSLPFKVHVNSNGGSSGSN